MVGSLTLEATVEPGAPGPIVAPETAEALPERRRYAVEQAALLEGL